MINGSINRYFYLIVSLFCLLVLGICYLYGVHLGLNTRITAGVELDASNITIALSRLWYGLHEGYVGYQEIYSALFHVLVPDNNPNNPANYAFLSDPSAIQKAFDNVRTIIPAFLPKFSVLSSEFISVNMEDHGLADFYTLAFMIFGVRPTAMYNMYFLVLIVSATLFIIEYRKQIFPLVLISLILGTFPIFFFSNNFSVFVPSINANRFMSTLGFLPIVHILCIYFKSTINLNRLQIIRIIGQALIFAFALSIRSTTQWELIALMAYALYTGITLIWPYRKQIFVLDRLRLLLHPVLSSTLLFFIIVSGYQKIQGMLLNPIYHTDCSPANHAIWHNTYISLAMNPEWKKFHPETADMNDGTAFHYFEDYMKNKGLDYICHVTGTYSFGLHELVIKQEYFSFIKKHKGFAVKLYAYYKPRAILRSFAHRIANISWPILPYCLLLSIIAGMILTRIANRSEYLSSKKIMATATVFLLASWLPSMVAYPSSYNNDDLWILVIYLCLGICMLTVQQFKNLNFAIRNSIYIKAEGRKK